jgi:Sulfotransferase domain
LLQGVCDIPPAAFAEELIAAYPEAKVVILNRDVDKWYQSMEQTLLRAGKPTPWRIFVSLLDWRQMGQVHKMFGLMVPALFGSADPSAAHLKKFFVEYHDNIRRIVPKDRLLEYKVQDGYQPLCDFLQVPVPTKMVGEKEVEEAFPKVNDSATFNERVAVAQMLSRRRAFKNMATFVGLTGLVGLGLWYLRGRY